MDFGPFLCFSCVVSLLKCKMRAKLPSLGLAPAPTSVTGRVFEGTGSVTRFVLGPPRLSWSPLTWAGSPWEQLLALPGACSSSWQDCFAFLFGSAANGCCSFPKGELEIPSSFGLCARLWKAFTCLQFGYKARG